MYDPDPKNWNCIECGENVADALLKFINQTYVATMPTAIEFYCPQCGVTLEIYLDWRVPTIRSVEIAHCNVSKWKADPPKWHCKCGNLISMPFGWCGKCPPF